MLLNIIAHSWIIGSITLLIVKQDEKTGAYRESIQTLKQYSTLHRFPKRLEKSLRAQLKLDFNNREISDEYVLANFPTETRRKVLRRLYLPSLMQTSLMKGIRQQFVDSFLTTCNVEIFSSGEEILQRGSISSDLYLLVAGVVKLVPFVDRSIEETQEGGRGSNFNGTSNADPERHVDTVVGRTKEVGSGEFINEIGFFTESPQLETVRTKTVCKTLAMPRSAYKLIAENHPGSVVKVLQNLLEKVQELSTAAGVAEKVNLPTRLTILRAGSIYDDGLDNNTPHDADYERTIHSIQSEASLTAVEDLVKMHMNKLKDDHTTRFLFAASRGDTMTICLMCDQGFDPNNADYDQRTALMVSAMKGNTETVRKILEYQTNANLVDVHGTSALYEAARNGHEETMNVLLEHGAELCMEEGQAASILCQAVFDGDILTLERLLKAGIPVNAGDYDKRTAAHVASAEGNVAALRVLVDFGADLSLQDRWGNTVNDEAKWVNASQLLKYLKTLRSKQEQSPPQDSEE
jgi:ankyrin repeat protein/CRP-like cAMP-binding protein